MAFQIYKVCFYNLFQFKQTLLIAEILHYISKKANKLLTNLTANLFEYMKKAGHKLTRLYSVIFNNPVQKLIVTQSNFVVLPLCRMMLIYLNLKNNINNFSVLLLRICLLVFSASFFVFFIGNFQNFIISVYLSTVAIRWVIFTII